MLHIGAFSWSITHFFQYNALIIKEVSLTQQLIWDKIRSLASVWCKANGLFDGVPLTYILWDWEALLC